MPLKHIRVCPLCDGQVRWAPCSIGCRIPDDQDKASWLENIQQGAGTFEAKLPSIANGAV